MRFYKIKFAGDENWVQMTSPTSAEDAYEKCNAPKGEVRYVKLTGKNKDRNRDVTVLINLDNVEYMEIEEL